MQSNLEKRLMGAAVKSREAYEEIFSRILPETLSPLGLASFELIRDYYETDKDSKEVSLEVLQGRLEAKFSNPKHVGAISGYLESLDPEISVPNLLYDIRLFKQQRLGDDIALDLANKADPKIVLEKMIQYQDIGLETDDKDENIFVSYPLGELLNISYSVDSLIKLLPKELNNRIDGGCRAGHHILVYARPEIGKTLFLINLTAGFLAQGLRVLYVGNEDPAADILLRVVGRLSRMTKQEVMNDPRKAEEIAKQRGYDNLIVAGLSPGNFFEIRKLVEKFDPKIVILDQLRNIEVNSESRVQALEKAATEARNLAKKYGLVVVSATQAGDSAEGQAILGRGDVDFSKTGIPGAVDLMIGIGADDSMEKHGLRTISLPKNKLSGCHDYFTVSINAQLGTIEAA